MLARPESSRRRYGPSPPSHRGDVGAVASGLDQCPVCPVLPLLAEPVIFAFALRIIVGPGIEELAAGAGLVGGTLVLLHGPRQHSRYGSIPVGVGDPGNRPARFPEDRESTASRPLTP